MVARRPQIEKGAHAALPEKFDGVFGAGGSFAGDIVAHLGDDRIGGEDHAHAVFVAMLDPVEILVVMHHQQLRFVAHAAGDGDEVVLFGDQLVDRRDACGALDMARAGIMLHKEGVVEVAERFHFAF